MLAALIMVCSGAALADVLVVRSTGPSAKSYPPGKRLSESARVTLGASDLLVVLNGQGTRNLRGPGTFTVGAPASTRTASAAPAPLRRARIGAVRGAGTGELRAPSIWHVDVTKSSTVCVADVGKLTLWRGDAARATMLSVTRVRDGVTKQVAWPAAASTLGWPADLPVTDGSEFRLSWKGAATPTSLKFRTMSQKPAGLEDMASALISNRCDAQMDLFIETVRLPTEAPPKG